MTKKLTFAIFIWAFMLLVHVPLTPHAATPEELQRQFDDAYMELLSNPGDLDLTLKYAELAVDIGDYEAAIPPLERILMSNPDLPKIRLELGILYYLLGSNDLAKNYFKEAKQGAKAQPDIVKQADDYLLRMK